MTSDALWQASLLHDLRTQIGTIVLNAQMLADDMTAADAPDIVATLLASARTAQTLMRRLGQPATALVPLPVDLRALVDEVILACRPSLRARAIEVQVDGVRPCPVLADRVSVLQILTNLVVNAMDAISGPGRIVVTLSAGRMEIADSGPGVAPGIRHRLFEPAVTTKPVGEGLGLYVARTLARQMQGDLGVCEATAGACFSLQLPTP